MINSALIGHGYWGKNLARVFAQSDSFNLHTVCDLSDGVLQKVEKAYPHASRLSNFKEIAKEVDLVAVATPASTHFELAEYFLKQGKHVLLSKPFARSVKEADALLELSEKQDRVVFVDHTFVFHPAVRKLKELLPRVGKPYFLLSQRLNLGLYQPDVNVIDDLMPHDLSIISYLLEREVKSSETSAFRAAGLPQEDLAHATIDLGEGIRGLLTASWLSPFKVRQFFVVGSEGMLCYDDNQVTEKIKFYDKGISLKQITDPKEEVAYTSLISYRSGDLFSPAVANEEALQFELKEILRAIDDKEVRRQYGRLNRMVMLGLERIHQGIKPYSDPGKHV